jgi:hypothetical protein
MKIFLALSMIYSKILKNLITVSLILSLIFPMTLIAGCIEPGHREFRMDIWVLKTDARGAMEWIAVIDDDPNNRGEGIIQTSDGGYAIAGTGTDARQNGPVPSIFRLDKNGNIQPNISLGRSPDYGSSIAVAPDNGYVITSYSGILFRVTENGTVLWSLPLNKGNDWGKVISVPEGGYAVAGGNRVVMVNEEGTIAWTTVLEKGRNASMIIAEPDGGFVTGGAAGADVWIARLNADGGMLFNTTFRSVSPAGLYSIRVSPTGTYEIIYGSDAYRGDEKAGNWISNITESSITMDGRQVRDRPANVSRIITTTYDGGYAYTGFADPQFTDYQDHSYPGSPLRLVRTDKEGNVILNISYDYRYNGLVSSIIQTDDGGFAIMGRKYNQ